MVCFCLGFKWKSVADPKSGILQLSWLHLSKKLLLFVLFQGGPVQRVSFTPPNGDHLPLPVIEVMSKVQLMLNVPFFVNINT